MAEKTIKAINRIDPQSIDERFILNFKFSKFQQEVIKLIYEMRVLTTSQIIDISNLTKNYVRAQLLDLYKNGFVYRKDKKAIIGGGTIESYWMLDRGGALFLAGAYGVSIKSLNWALRDNLIALEKLQHSMKISEVRTILEVTARERGHKIENCLSDRHLFFEFRHEDKKHVLRPDLFFTYNDGEHLYQYFFEIDMGTMSINGPKSRTSNVISKIPKYEGYKLSNAWKDSFDAYPRVIFLTTNKKRALYMLESVQQNQTTKLEFLFSTFDFFNQDPLGINQGSYMRTDKTTTSLFE